MKSVSQHGTAGTRSTDQTDQTDHTHTIDTIDTNLAAEAAAPLPTEHGGPGAAGPARWDFSTNANAAGPCPAALAAVRAADPLFYPDPQYTALRERLAAWHGVAPQRIVLAASGSEFIQRISRVSQHLAPGAVALPLHAYGDYARAAQACGRVHHRAGHSAWLQATLRWHCDPGSPLGQDDPPQADDGPGCTVLDAVYAPMRLHGTSRWSPAAAARVFVLHSPNKALGLCGVRGAYAVAPQGRQWQPWLDALAQAAPSWVLGAQGVALLDVFVGDESQRWLAQSLHRLQAWKTQLQRALVQAGVAVQPSVAPFFCARLGVAASALRPHGVQVRDAASFGQPGWARLRAMPPAAQAALLAALKAAQTAAVKADR